MALFSKIKSAVKSVVSKVTGKSSSSSSSSSPTSSTSSSQTSSAFSGTSSLGSKTFSGSSSSGTYYPDSQTYVDESGQGYSVAEAPSGAKVSSGTDPNLKRHSSSGSSSIQQSSKIPQSTISATSSPSFNEAKNIISTKAKNEGIIKAAVIAPRVLIDSAFNKTERQERKNLKQIQRNELGNELINTGKSSFSKEDRSYTSPQGMTAESYRKTPYTSNEIVTLAATGEISPQAAVKGIINIELKPSQENIKRTKIDEENRLNKLTKDLNSKIISGEISRSQAEEKLNLEIDKSNEIIQGVTDLEKEKIETKVKKIVPNITLQRALFSVPLIAAVGFGAGAALSFAPAAVQSGAAIVGGLVTAKEVSDITQGLGSGELGGKDVLAFGISSGAFITGFAAGSKVTSAGRTAKLQSDLNEAIKRSDIVVDTKGIVKETSLKSLEIPEMQKARIKGQLEAGATASKVEVKLRPASTSDQALIDKELPYKNIEFIEITDRVGNVIDRVAVGKVELQGKSGKVFKQDIISQSEMFITPEGTIEGTTLTASGREGKGIEKAILTSETSRGNIVSKKAGIRVVKTDTGIRLIEAIESKGKPLTMKELNDLVTRGFGERGTPTAEAQFYDIQKRTGLKIDAIIANSRALVLKNEKLLTGGRGVSTTIIESEKRVPVKRTPLDKTFKEIDVSPESSNNFVKDVLKESGKQGNIKKINIESTKAIEELYNPKVSGRANVETGVRASFEKGIQEIVNVPRAASFPLDINMLNEKQIMQQTNNMLKNLNINAQQFNQNLNSLSSQIQPQALDVNQILQQAQSQAGSFQAAPSTIPVIPPIYPEIPYGSGFGRNTEAGLKKLNKEIAESTKRASEYSASLSSAVSGESIEINTENLMKGLKELGETEYLGFEARPLLKLTNPKPKKKKKK